MSILIGHRSVAEGADGCAGLNLSETISSAGLISPNGSVSGWRLPRRGSDSFYGSMQACARYATEMECSRSLP